MTENKQHVEKIKELIKDIKFAMFTTLDQDFKMHSRPMATHEGDNVENELWFITSDTSPKVFEIFAQHRIGLAYQKDYSFVTISGKAEVVKDHKKLDEIWSPAYNAWFPKGKSDPDICLIKVTPETGEYWTTPSKTLTYAVKFLSNVVRGEKTDIGDHEKVNF